MTHRYGRHGTKAWLRWRKRHLRRNALTFVPQVAVLNVPLDFLARIRKVTIVMEDGRTIEAGTETGQLVNSPVVDAETDEHGAILLEDTQGPKYEFLSSARILARRHAGKVFNDAKNPYIVPPNLEAAEDRAETMYPTTLGRVSHDEKDYENWARDLFIEEYIDTYQAEIAELSTKHEADSKELQDLLVFARTDKTKDKGTRSQYADNRAVIQAYRSLLPDTPNQEGVVEGILPLLPTIIAKYQKFYDEFQPKEED